MPKLPGSKVSFSSRLPTLSTIPLLLSQHLKGFLSSDLLLVLLQNAQTIMTTQTKYSYCPTFQNRDCPHLQIALFLKIDHHNQKWALKSCNRLKITRHGCRWMQFRLFLNKLCIHNCCFDELTWFSNDWWSFTLFTFVVCSRIPIYIYYLVSHCLQMPEICLTMVSWTIWYTSIICLCWRNSSCKLDFYHDFFFHLSRFKLICAFLILLIVSQFHNPV